MNLNEKIKIVIIDSGIDISKSDMGKYVTKHMKIRIEDGYIRQDDSIEVDHEHGTAISMIIRNICEYVELISINILNANLECDSRILVESILRAIDLKPNIIHMSLGTDKIKHRFMLHRAIKTACKNNIFIVAAYSNDGKRTYPAFFKEVIGVKGQAEIIDNSIYYRDTNFIASDKMNNILGQEDLIYKNAVGNSMAAAYVTGYLAKQLYINTNINREMFIKLCYVGASL